MFLPGKAKVERLKHGYHHLLDLLKSCDVDSIKLENPLLLRKMKLDVCLDLADDLTKEDIQALSQKYTSKLDSHAHISSVVAEDQTVEEEESSDSPPPVQSSFTSEEIARLREMEVNGLRSKYGVDELDVPKSPPGRCGYKRECDCGLEIGVLHWSEHLTTKYHKLQTDFAYMIRGFCWYSDKSRVPQDCPGQKECQVCARALDIVANMKSHNVLGFSSTYVPEDDELLQEFLNDSKQSDARHCYCRKCDKACFKEEFLQSHINSLLHKLKSGPSCDKIAYHCKKCNVRTFTKDYYITHLESKKHRQVIEGSYNPPASPKESTPKPTGPGLLPKVPSPSPSGPGLLPKVPSPPSAPASFHCSTCDFTARKECNWDKHVSSHNHRKKVGEDTDKIDLYCRHCDFTARDKCNLDRHVSSKRHIKNAGSSLGCPVDTVTSSDDPATFSDNVGEVSTAQCTERGGKKYFMTFNRPLKYKIGKKLIFRLCKCVFCKVRVNSIGALNRHNQTQKHKDRVKCLTNRQKHYRLRVDKRLDKENKSLDNDKSFASVVVIGNEFSNVELPFSHCHMFLQTEEKTHFKTVKKYIRTITKSNHITDIQRPKDIPAVIKYITKSDRRAFTLKCPTKLLSPQFKARLYFRTGHKCVVNWGHEIPSSVAQCDRQIFEDSFKEEVMHESIAAMYRANCYKLRPWQREIEEMLLNTTTREVIWLVDSVGGSGKTTFCSHLLSTRSCIVFKDLSYRENIFLYEKQATVVFDLGRDFVSSEQQEGSSSIVSYHILEALKDGYAISKKYVPQVKVFSPPAVLVLSNEFPEKKKLSLDRWNVQVIDEYGQMHKDTSYNEVD